MHRLRHRAAVDARNSASNAAIRSWPRTRREPRCDTHASADTLTAALEGERKFVTVLFADLKGSMELVADRDPEEARKLLDPVLEHMCEAVEQYGGTVSQVMGDGIMALFGAPIAAEDHAVRAARAALTMQDLVRHYGDEIQRTHGVPIQIRVGLNSGEVVLRMSEHGLHMSYTAIGVTVHIAARMEQIAKPGSILATADTVRLAGDHVESRPIGPAQGEGFRAADRSCGNPPRRPVAFALRRGADARDHTVRRAPGRAAADACRLRARGEGTHRRPGGDRRRRRHGQVAAGLRIHARARRQERADARRRRGALRQRRRLPPRRAHPAPVFQHRGSGRRERDTAESRRPHRRAGRRSGSRGRSRSGPSARAARGQSVPCAARQGAAEPGGRSAAVVEPPRRRRPAVGPRLRGPAMGDVGHAQVPRSPRQRRPRIDAHRAHLPLGLRRGRSRGAGARSKFGWTAWRAT